MSHPTLDKLAKSREKLLAVVGTLQDEKLDLSLADGWTIRQTLTHLIASEGDHCRVAALVARDEGHRLPPPFDLDQYNARRLAESGHLSHADLLAALDAQRQRTLDLFNSLSEEQLAKVGRHPVLGEIAVGDVFRVLAMHEQMHTRDIQSVLKNVG